MDFARGRILIQKLLENIAPDDGFGDDLVGVLRLYVLVEQVLGLNEDVRLRLAETVTSRHAEVDPVAEIIVAMPKPGVSSVPSSVPLSGVEPGLPDTSQPKSFFNIQPTVSFT